MLVLFAALSGFGAACGEDEDIPWPAEPTSVGPIALPPGRTIGAPAFPIGPADAVRFSGVAGVYLGLSCSGAFVVPSAADLAADGPAYVLTAGHCVLGIARRPNEVVIDEPLFGLPNALSLGLFADLNGPYVAPVPVRTVFGSLKGTDLALIELAQTRVELRRMGVVPFVLADEPSRDDEEIAIAIRVEQGGLLSTCHVERRVPFLLEAPFHFFDVEANRCPNVGFGTSGSPVLSLATGKVVSVISTGVVAAARDEEPCRLNAPCEAAPPGVRFEPGTNYAVPVAGLGACFDGTGRFVGAGACPLDRGKQMQPTDADYRLPAAASGDVAFDLILGAQGLTHYRTLVAPVGTDDCRDVSRYGPVVSAAATARTIHARVPGEPGQHLVCVQAGAGPDPAAGGWQDAGQPTMVVAAVDAPSAP